MPTRRRTLSWQKLQNPVRGVLFFFPFYLYVWLRIDPRLLYHVQEPVFFRGSAFFADFAAYPGGLSEYLSAFLSQSFFFPWAGALLITAIAWLIYLTTRSFLTAVGGICLQTVSFAPAIFLLVLHNSYRYPLSLDLGLLIALAFLLIYVRMPLEHSGARLPVLLALSALLYYVAPGPFLLYALLCGLFELLTRRRLYLGLACLLSALFIPYLATTYIFPVRTIDSFTHSLPFYGDFFQGDSRLLMAAFGLYSFFPIATLGTALWRWFNTGDSKLHKTATSPSTKKFSAYFHGNTLKWAGQTLILLIAAALLALSSFNSNYQTLTQLDFYTRHKMWEQALEKADDLTAYNVLAVYDIQRTLCNLGQLPDDMFSYPYLTDAPVFLPSPQASSNLVALCDILLELGHVNKAEHMAHEALEIHGDRPSILQRLVLINILKGRVQAARVFLGLLEKTLLHRNWAQRYQRALNSDPQLSNDRQLAKIRSFMIEEDYAGYFPPEVLLQQVLARNSKNLLAFEYLMAHCLSTGRLDEIVRNIGRLNDFPDRYPHTAIPRHYEEAILLYMQARLQRGRTAELPLAGRKISPETARRFRAFGKALATYGDDKETLRRQLAPAYGNTYWFYYIFRASEAERNSLPSGRKKN